MTSIEIKNSKSLKLLKTALFCCFFASNAHRQSSACSPQDSLSVVDLRWFAKFLLVICLHRWEFSLQHSASVECGSTNHCSCATRTCQCLWVCDRGDASCDSWRVTVSCWRLLFHGRRQLCCSCCLTALCCRCVPHAQATFNLFAH